MDFESRFEIKYNLKDFDEIFIKKNILNSTNLNKIYEDRIINSIYFDTNNFICANDNLSGQSARKKFRLRSYNNNSNYNFEIKIKENKLTRKILLNKNIFLKNQNIKFQKINNFLKKNYLIKICKISYLRSYYKFKDLRVTYDRNLKYESLINNNGFSKMKSKDKILEIKYKHSNQNIKNLNYFTFRLPTTASRNSKYLNSLNELGIIKF